MGILTSKDFGQEKSLEGDLGASPRLDTGAVDTSQWMRKDLSLFSMVGLTILGEEYALKAKDGVITLPDAIVNKPAAWDELNAAGFIPADQAQNRVAGQETGTEAKEKEGPYTLYHPDQDAVDTEIEVKIGRKKPVTVTIDRGVAVVEDIAVAKELIDRGWTGSIHESE